MKQKKVVFISYIAWPEGGGDTTRLKTLMHLANLCGKDVTYIKLWKNGDRPHSNKIFESKGLTVVSQGNAFLSMLPNPVPQLVQRALAATLLIKLILSGQVGTIAINNMGVGAGIIFLGIAKIFRVHSIFFLDDDFSVAEGNSLNAKFQRLSNKLAYIVLGRSATVCGVQTDYLEKKINRKHGTFVIPHLLQLDTYQERKSVQNAHFEIYYCGMLGGQDELENLLRAIPVLKPEYQMTIRIKIAGCAFTPERAKSLKELSRELGIIDRVQFIERLTFSENELGIQNADLIWCVRRLSEWSLSGLSTKLAEALACGKSVVTNGFGENAKFVENRKNAMVVDPTNIQEIKAAIEEVVANPDFRRRLEIAARESAVRYFDANAYVERGKFLFK